MFDVNSVRRWIGRTVPWYVIKLHVCWPVSMLFELVCVGCSILGFAELIFFFTWGVIKNMIKHFKKSSLIDIKP